MIFINPTFPRMRLLLPIKFLVVIALLLSYSNQASAQIIVVPDTLSGWGGTWVANLNGSQSSFNNWSEGGSNTISGTASTVFTRYTRKDKLAYGFRINLRYGQSKLNGNDVRKTDDMISIRNRVTYELGGDGPKYSAYGAVQFKTQFADGYDYEGAVAGGDSLTSGWFAPAYFIEGAGLEAILTDHFGVEVGLALKQTIVNNEALYDQYGLDSGKNYRAEGGITLGAQYQNSLMDNIELVTSVETFTNLLKGVDETDVIWSTDIIGQINDIFSAVFQFELRYDADYSEDIQLKEIFAAGISINLY